MASNKKEAVSNESREKTKDDEENDEENDEDEKYEDGENE